jgi:hypothetical protein
MMLRPIPYLLIIILIFKMTTGHTQSKPLNKKITLEVKDMTLEDLFEKLQQDYHVKLVYGADHFPLSQVITLKADNISLKYFIDKLCVKTGLSYYVVDEYVIFQYKTPVLAPAHQDSQRTKVIVVSEQLVTKPEEVIQNDSLPNRPREARAVIEPTIVIRELPDLDSIAPPSSLQIIKPIIVSKGDGARKTKARLLYRVALYASYDHHLFHFKTLPDKNQEYKLKLSSSFGGSFSASLGKKTFLGFGFMYSSKNFTYHRNFRILNPDDAVSIPDVTSLSFTYIEIPFEIEYHFIGYKKLSVNLVPGIDAAFLIDKEERTQYLTHGQPATEYFVNETNSFLWGPQAAVKIEYPLLESLSIFISPRYIHYIKPVNEATMHSGNDLFRFQAGIQLNIKKS